MSDAEPAAKLHALVVDDEPAILHCLSGLLESEGFQVFSAAGPSEALAISRTRPEHIDLLLTDLYMKEVMNGIQLAESIRRERAGIAVLIMSGTDGAEDLASASGYSLLAKPFFPAALFDRVRRALEPRIPPQREQGEGQSKGRSG